MDVSRDILERLTQRLVACAGPRRVILFGSYARGTARAGSDVDVVVVEDAPFGAERSRRAELQRIRRALADVRVAKDIILCSSAEYEEWRQAPNHVIAHAEREGVVLYER